MEKIYSYLNQKFIPMGHMAWKYLSEIGMITKEVRS